jgi:hypothetical protein
MIIIFNRLHFGLITQKNHTPFGRSPVFNIKAILKGSIMKEIWKSVVGYEGIYEVSNFGRIKSLDRFDSNNRFVKGRFIKPVKRQRVHNPYLGFTACINGSVKNIKIHHAVAYAFIGNRPDGMVIDHIDNDKKNNRLDNLQYITIRENCSKDSVGTSRYTGVYLNKKTGKWKSQIHINRKLNHIGTFSSEDDAGEAYLKKLREVNDE